jgi:formate/nitrite transporter FocA (FNT family)
MSTSYRQAMHERDRWREEVRLTFEDSCKSWCDVGTNHSEAHWSQHILRSLWTGMYLNIGFTLGIRAMVRASNQEFLFGIGFAVGLVFINLTDSFLFTQDLSSIALSVLMRRSKLTKGLRALGIVFVFNYVGAVIGALFFGILCDFFKDPTDPLRIAILNIGIAKSKLGVGAMISRAMFCNWMVCLADFLQSKTDSIGGKIACVMLPISAFAGIGLEHCTVNMSILTECLFLDRKCFSLGYYFLNLFIVIVGNVIGGLVAMTLPAFYALWFASKPKHDDIENEMSSQDEDVGMRAVTSDPPPQEVGG